MADWGWLKTHHTFSFSSYYDPQHMGFRALRVINEDYVNPQGGFETHRHEDMEIISYIFQGAIEHRDSNGNRSILRAGEVQRMTAGTGITHSERNPSNDEVLGFFQIWIEPAEKGLKPDYESMSVRDDAKRGQLKLLVSPKGDKGSLKIHQNAYLYASILASGEEVNYRIEPVRHLWVQLLRGSLELEGEDLNDGDGAAISKMSEVTVVAALESEFLLMDLE